MNLFNPDKTEPLPKKSREIHEPFVNGYKRLQRIVHSFIMRYNRNGYNRNICNKFITNNVTKQFKKRNTKILKSKRFCLLRFGGIKTVW